MAGSIRNNNSAYGGVDVTAADLTTFTFGGWFKVNANAYSNGDVYQEIAWTSAWAYSLGVTFETDTDVLFYDGPTDVNIATGGDTQWHYVFWVKSGTSLTAKRRVKGTSTWTTIGSWTITDTEMEYLAILQSGWPFAVGTYNTNIRSWRLWNIAKPDADMTSESGSRVPLDTANLRLAAADGETPNPAGTNWNGGTYGSITLGTFGTAVADSDDPIDSAGGPLSIAAAVAGTSTVAAPMRRNLRLAAAAAGVGAVASPLKKRVPLTAATNGTGTVAGNLTRRTPIAATVAGIGAVAAAARKLTRIGAAAVGVGTVSADAKASKPLAAAVSGTGTVTANTPAAAKRLGAAANAVGVVVATLGVRRGLVASSTGMATVAATLNTTAGQQLTAATNGVGAVSAALRAVRRVASSVTGAGAVAGSLRKRVPLAASVVGGGVVDADLTATSGLVASSNGAGAVAATLRVRRGLAAGVVGSAVVGATARALRRLAAAVEGAGVVVATAATNSSDPVAAAVTGTGVVAAALRLRQRLAAAITGAASFVASLRRYGETITTPYTLRPTAPRYTVRPAAPLYTVRGNMDRYPAFDPQTRDYVEFDLIDFVATRGVAIASATIVQVDGNDAPIGTPTIDLLATTVTGTKARAYVNGVTALVGSLLRLRCSFVFADGRTGNTSGILPIKHT